VSHRGKKGVRKYRKGETEEREEKYGAETKAGNAGLKLQGVEERGDRVRKPEPG